LGALPHPVSNLLGQLLVVVGTVIMTSHTHN